MDIVQTFYDDLASQYDKLFENWRTTVHEQADILNSLFGACGFAPGANVLDCACGIGTQAIGLSLLGYDVTASDISLAELSQARERAQSMGAEIEFAHADFRALHETFSKQFKIVIAMDNALPHMLTEKDLEKAIQSMTERIVPGGMLVASIRDYDALLETKPPYSPPYIHRTKSGQRVAFQTWNWQDDHYKLIQYIIDDEQTLQTSRFECEYRATRRAELTELLLQHGCKEVLWKFPEETGFYQPIVIARK